MASDSPLRGSPCLLRNEPSSYKKSNEMQDAGGKKKLIFLGCVGGLLATAVVKPRLN